MSVASQGAWPFKSQAGWEGKVGVAKAFKGLIAGARNCSLRVSQKGAAGSGGQQWKPGVPPGATSVSQGCALWVSHQARAWEAKPVLPLPGRQAGLSWSAHTWDYSAETCVSPPKHLHVRLVPSASALRDGYVCAEQRQVLDASASVQNPSCPVYLLMLYLNIAQKANAKKS